jgi:adenylate cyclase
MLLTGMLAYATTFAFRWRSLRAGMFGVVKGDLLARILEEEPRHPGLRGEERVVSVLFSDIRGFTSWSRRHSPSEVVALLNAYFEAMVPLIEAGGGTVDKYIGDGIMAIFGAPDDQPDHAARAVRVAAAMVAQVHDLAPIWSKHDFEGFRIGVGVATGSAVVGLVGSRRRLDNTAIGDTINTAARVESANKAMNSEILIAERTRNAAGPDVLEAVRCAESPETVAAHGVAEGLVVYRIGARVSPIEA